ncbi:MAG: dihydroorotate dehydrogenase-like protein [Gammaproteobacteria bacterium]
MDLKTRYLGLELEHPIVAGASPLSTRVDDILRMEDAGAAAVVMHSLFEEQLRQEAAAMERLTETVEDNFAEALSYFPPIDGYKASSERYLETLRQARERTSIPIIGSLNGVTPEGWVDHAAQMQAAGASAIELNVYYLPADLDETGADVERRYSEVVHAVKAAVDIPLAIKVGPFFSAFGHTAKLLAAAGADGIVMFNRFYRPDFDTETLEANRTLELSTPQEIRVGLFWLSLLYGRLDADMAASSGVDSAKEVVKYLLAGADVVMTTSALLRYGVEHLGVLRRGLEAWMGERSFERVGQVRGRMSLANVENATAYERANYIRLLEDYETRAH